MENFNLYNIVIVSIPFLSYFVGIVIKKLVMPGRRSLCLYKQLLLGIPVSLVVVSPLLPVFATTKAGIPGFLVTIGIIMEHGMIVNETATFHIKRLTDGLLGNSPRATGSGHARGRAGSKQVAQRIEMPDHEKAQARQTEWQ